MQLKYILRLRLQKLKVMYVYCSLFKAIFMIVLLTKRDFYHSDQHYNAVQVSLCDVHASFVKIRHNTTAFAV